ncbi:nucleoside deaminase [Pediococcus stilesii]|uniref:tRNA-specific adenosine deaminase n=1 Tax=Pediococcus stilesii TaxID=331679 RepID=A0A0R2KYM3_9LACO|nr:nucleoside deaminase [Pediococcus stilesii]KRN94498.1 tRNA-adenosine deaminase [Pediococcus stilesii]TLQ04008.1 nucleoside deaminase [Pediococcus stilesii]
MNKLTEEEITFYMNEAIKEAEFAKMIDEVPIGAVVVHDGQIIGRGHNLREHSQDATTHAEVLAITEACAFLNSWRLWDCQLFVTIEPCLMCSGTIINSQLPAVFFGARDPKAGAVRSLYTVLEDSRLNHQVEVVEGIQSEQAAQLMKTFFKEIRQRRKKTK